MSVRFRPPAPYSRLFGLSRLFRFSRAGYVLVKFEEMERDKASERDDPHEGDSRAKRAHVSRKSNQRGDGSAAYKKTEGNCE